MATTIKTLADVLGTAQVDGRQFAYSNDRGNGCGGPHSIAVDEAPEYTDVPVTEVQADEDPEAWRLAWEALQGAPERVWVGERGTGSNPHQMVYAY